MDEEKKTGERRLGRPRGPRRGRYQLLLDEVIAEWAKQTDEGLSAMVRRLLRDEHDRQQRKAVAAA